MVASPVDDEAGTAWNDEVLYDRLEALLHDAGTLRTREAAIIACAAVYYPYCRLDKLATTAEQTLQKKKPDKGYTAGEIEESLQDIDRQTDLFEPRDADGTTGLVNRYALAHENAGFIDKLRDHLLEAAPDTDVAEVMDELQAHFTIYTERRMNTRVKTLPTATSGEGTDSFIEDITLDNNPEATELCIPAFSFEVLRNETFKSRIREWYENGKTVKLLLYSEELGATVEPESAERVRTTISDTKDILAQLRDTAEHEDGELQYRLIHDRTHSYFRGAVIRSDTADNCRYRVLVFTDTERGVNAPVVKGQGNTMLYKILDRYFAEAWAHAQSPTWRGNLIRFFKDDKFKVYAVALLLMGLVTLALSTITVVPQIVTEVILGGLIAGLGATIITEYISQRVA